MSDKTYYDDEGNPCALRQMMRREPEWMLSRMETLEQAFENAHDAAVAERGRSDDE